MNSNDPNEAHLKRFCTVLQQMLEEKKHPEILAAALRPFHKEIWTRVCMLWQLLIACPAFMQTHPEVIKKIYYAGVDLSQLDENEKNLSLEAIAKLTAENVRRREAAGLVVVGQTLE